MHTYRILEEPNEIDTILRPIFEKNGSEIPDKGCCIAAVEFDEDGQVVAYQLLQNAIFLEGLWSRDHSSNLLTLYRMACKYAIDKLKAKSIMTMSRNDIKGNRIGRLANALGMEKMDWSIFRRRF